MDSYGSFFVKISSNSDMVMLETSEKLVELTRNDPAVICFLCPDTSACFSLLLCLLCCIVVGMDNADDDLLPTMVHMLEQLTGSGLADDAEIPVRKRLLEQILKSGI